MSEDQSQVKDHVGRLADIVLANQDLMSILTQLRDCELPDAWLTSGAVYGTVWNSLTGRPHRHGIKDYDLIYYDGADLSWNGEDVQVRRVARLMKPLRLPVELRNQARVHLWFKKRFGSNYPQLFNSKESLNYYASKTHSVAVRLINEEIDVTAPFGLENVFNMQIVPNPILNNQATYAEKAARAMKNWPEVVVQPWD